VIAVSNGSSNSSLMGRVLQSKSAGTKASTIVSNVSKLHTGNNCQDCRCHKNSDARARAVIGFSDEKVIRTAADYFCDESVCSNNRFCFSCRSYALRVSLRSYSTVVPQATTPVSHYLLLVQALASWLHVEQQPW